MSSLQGENIMSVIDLATASIEEVLIDLNSKQCHDLKTALQCIAERDERSLLAGKFHYKLREYLGFLCRHLDNTYLNHEVVRCMSAAIAFEPHARVYNMGLQFTHLSKLVHNHIHMTSETLVLVMKLLCKVRFLSQTVPIRLLPTVIALLSSFEERIPGRRNYGRIEPPLTIDKWIITTSKKEIDVHIIDLIFDVLEKFISCATDDTTQRFYDWACLVYSHVGRLDLLDYSKLVRLMQVIVETAELRFYTDASSQFYFDLMHQHATGRFLDLMKNPPLHDCQMMLNLIEVWTLCVRYVGVHLSTMVLDTFVIFAMRVFNTQDEHLHLLMYVKWTVLADKLAPLITVEKLCKLYVHPHKCMLRKMQSECINARVFSNLCASWQHLLSLLDKSDVSSYQRCYEDVIAPFIKNLQLIEDYNKRRYVVNLIMHINAKILAFIINTLSTETAEAHQSFWKEYLCKIPQFDNEIRDIEITRALSLCGDLFLKKGFGEIASRFAMAFQPLLYLVKSSEFREFKEKAHPFANTELVALFNRCDTSKYAVRFIRACKTNENESDTEDDDEPLPPPLQPRQVRSSEAIVAEQFEGLRLVVPPVRVAKRLSREDEVDEESEEQTNQRRRKTFDENLKCVLDVTDEHLRQIDLSNLRMLIARFNCRINELE